MGKTTPENLGGLEGLRLELQLETIYDLLVALHAHRSEQELIDDLLQRVCSVVDPGRAVAVTRDAAGVGQLVATVGWEEAVPSAEDLLSEQLWRDVLSGGASIRRSEGELLGQRFTELVAIPLEYRGLMLGFLAVLDKEHRQGGSAEFSRQDLRFLETVAAVGALMVDGLRERETLVHRSERLEQENQLLKEQLVHEVAGQRIVAGAEPMQRALQLAERIAPRNVNVLVRGESGTGKELVARLLHEQSTRTGSLVVVNCAAMPEALLESELFGIEGGVATGVQARIGKFELADQGTLFLDEIGDLELSLQVKLLRVLQEREIVRVGGHRTKQVNVRVVAATHRDLEALVSNSEFRGDLYYRLKGVQIDLPPLRQRREDIPQLVRYFLERFCRREGIPVPRVDRDALDLLLAADYAGNVRELQSVVEGAAALADGVMDRDLVTPLLRGRADSVGPEALDLLTLERRHIRKILGLTKGNKSAAARLLGVDRRTLQRKGF